MVLWEGEALIEVKEREIEPGVGNKPLAVGFTRAESASIEYDDMTVDGAVNVVAVGNV